MNKTSYTKKEVGAPYFPLMTIVRLIAVMIGALGGCPAATFAKEIRYRDYALEIREGDRLLIQGIKGGVKLTPVMDGKKSVLRARKTLAEKNPSNDLSSKFDSLSFNVRREGATVLIEARGPDTKNAWAQWLKPGTPEMLFELEVPQIPVEISFHEGQITAIGWRQALTLGLVSGSVKTAATDGYLKLQIQRGSVTVDRHHGSLLVDSFAAKVSVQELEGDLSLSNFAGDTTLAKVKGSLELSSNAGSTAITKSTGAIEFINGHGSFVATGFEGPVKGQTDQGAVNVAIDGDAEIRIESNQGAVSVKLPADSGSHVRMQTDEGNLAAPDAIKPNSSHAKLISGRLPGTGSKGMVTLKSKAGSLRVR